jgi:hypothetical protein
VEGSITTFLLSVERIDGLRLNAPDSVTVLFNVFVHNRTLSLDEEHEHLGGSSFFLLNAIVQFVTRAMNSLERSVEIAVCNDGITIDIHPVIIGSLT